MRLADLLEATRTAAGSVVDPAGDVEIAGIAADSRAVRPGWLFAALQGGRADGARFATDAARRGAAAILVGEGVALEGVPAHVRIVRATDARRRLALMAAAFSGPQPPTVVAVTGTSGKSSVAHFTRLIWESFGWKAASIGTLGVISPTLNREEGLTTPDPVALHADLAELARGGVERVAMEASSHGLDQRRLDGVRFCAGAYTNLGRDHLDYHVDSASYFRAKARLFDELLPPGAAAAINADDAHAEELVAIARRRGLRLLRYGFDGVELRLTDLKATASGQALGLHVEGAARLVDLPLVGAFQAHNALAALGLVLGAGADAARAVEALSRLKGAPGRLDLVAALDAGVRIFVDYAHKPEALEAVLKTVRASTPGKLRVVFGCGGDRDAGKRPIMGEIAARLADHVVVTDDNPRGENPAAIRSAVIAGARGGALVEEIGDRRVAILAAVTALAPGDVLVVAGKGHERGQKVGDTVLPFDDAQVVREAVAERRTHA